MKVTYYRSWGHAHISGAGGFTQVRMDEIQALAIARVLNIEFEVRP